MRLSRSFARVLVPALACCLQAAPIQAQEAAPPKPAAPPATQAAAQAAPKTPPAKKAAKRGTAPAKPDADAALQKDVAMQADLKRQVRKKARKAPKYHGPLVNLNAASREELMKLPNVSAAMADKLIAGRPYRTKADMVTRDIVPYGIYSSIKDRVAAVPPTAPK